jgi:hypothetical protein
LDYTCITGSITYSECYGHKELPLLQSQLHYGKPQKNDFPTCAITEVHQHLLRSWHHCQE